MTYIYNFIAARLATKLAKILFIFILNFVGIVSVIGIPIAVIIDVLFILMAIHNFFSNFSNWIYRIKPYVIKGFKYFFGILGFLLILSIVFAIIDAI